MKKSEIINKIHLGFITYFLFGFMIESQRKYLILFLPSLQYQFLVNNNQCLLTQLENKLIKNENDKKNEDDKEFDSFIGSKLKEYNIDIEGKEVVVIGKSNIVGLPMALIMMKEIISLKPMIIYLILH